MTEQTESKEAKPAPKKPSDSLTLRNESRNPHSIAGKVVPPGGKHELTKTQQDDERLMAKIYRSLELGVLSEVK